MALVIEEYITMAEPVSSKLLEKSGFCGLKSASIRAEMNQLERWGYLLHLHTSGGRIPTDRAYRYLVDNLISWDELEPSSQERKTISAVINDSDIRKLNKNIAHTLSVLSDSIVITSVIEQDDFFKFGLASLFEMPDFRELERAFKVTSFVDEFEKIFDRLERYISEDMENPRIFIGRENPVGGVKNETIILAKYNLPDGLTGSMTMIGPTRMDYEKNIGLVKYATEELNKLAQNI